MSESLGKCLSSLSCKVSSAPSQNMIPAFNALSAAITKRDVLVSLSKVIDEGKSSLPTIDSSCSVCIGAMDLKPKDQLRMRGFLTAALEGNSRVSAQFLYDLKEDNALVFGAGVFHGTLDSNDDEDLDEMVELDGKGAFEVNWFGTHHHVTGDLNGEVNQDDLDVNGSDLEFDEEFEDVDAFEDLKNKLK